MMQLQSYSIVRVSIKAPVAWLRRRQQAWPASGAHFQRQWGQLLHEFTTFEPWWAGGAFVGGR
jgi:hypothetical protein